MSHSNGGDNIKIGFIGAGKVGFSLGKYLKDGQQNIIGYYSKNVDSAKEAAKFTSSNYYNNISDLINNSEIIIITTPDGVIKEIWQTIKELSIKNKIICHCSGSLSSSIFSNIEDYNSYGYSIHPIFAFSDKYNSHNKLKEAFITIEGSNKYLDYLKKIFEGMGNKVQVISENNKNKYHSASVFASNHVIAIIDTSIELLKECGFSDNTALEALNTLIINNIYNVLQNGIINSLTGPIERNDIDTVISHLNCLEKDDRELYKLLSRRLLKIATIKNKDKNYSELKSIVEE